MARKDFSKNAPLLEAEIYDFDSDFKETGINEDRMRLPTRYDISKFYERNKTPSSYDEMGNPRYEKGKWKKKAEQLDFSEDFDWQITYKFPETLHPNKTEAGALYGGSFVTYRRLYLILCEHFNGGNYFIDEYFEKEYPSRMKETVDKSLAVIKEDLLDVASSMLEDYVDEEGNLLRGGKTRIREYEKFAREWEENESPFIANLIKEDIITCVTSGILPCQAFENSAETRKKRVKAGLEPSPRFTATEKLIRSLQLFVTIGGNKKWRTSQGILV